MRGSFVHGCVCERVSEWGGVVSGGGGVARESEWDVCEKVSWGGEGACARA